MDRVDIGDDVSHRLELVQKLHNFIHLIGEVYISAFVVPGPSLPRTLLLEFLCVAMHLVERSVDADGVYRQQSAYRLPILTIERFECIREYAASISCMGRA